MTSYLEVGFQLSDFTFRQQQLAVTLGFWVGVRAIEIRTDVHSFNPYFAMINVAEGINQRCLTQANGLDFRTREHDAGGISINEKILK